MGIRSGKGIRRKKISEVVGEDSKSNWKIVMIEAFGILKLGKI